MLLRFKATEVPSNRFIDRLLPPSNNRTFKEWICYQSDSSAGLHIGKIISKSMNRSLEMQIIKFQIHTYNADDNTYTLLPYDSSIDQRPINLVSKSNKCKVVKIKRSPVNLEFVLMTPLDIDLLTPQELDANTDDDNSTTYSSFDPRIIISQQSTYDPWINRWIDDTIIQDELNDLRLQITDLSHLIFYTDGSLQTDRYNNLRHLPIEERYTVKQSAAFIETNTSIRYTSRISNWPSSTRAELYAIFLALMICPMHSTVDIFTDSQCAIQGITGWLLANKKWTKFNNNLLLFKIGILVKKRT